MKGLGKGSKEARSEMMSNERNFAFFECCNLQTFIGPASVGNAQFYRFDGVLSVFKQSVVICGSIPVP